VRLAVGVGGDGAAQVGADAVLVGQDRELSRDGVIVGVVPAAGVAGELFQLGVGLAQLAGPVGGLGAGIGAGVDEHPPAAQVGLALLGQLDRPAFQHMVGVAPVLREVEVRVPLGDVVDLCRLGAVQAGEHLVGGTRRTQRGDEPHSRGVHRRHIPIRDQL
jgi:hypothetical protein